MHSGSKRDVSEPLHVHAHQCNATLYSNIYEALDPVERGVRGRSWSRRCFWTMAARGALPYSDSLRILYKELAHHFYFVMPTMTQK